MNDKIPFHIAIIMDGNRRWAKKNLLNLYDGHKKGADNIVTISQECIKQKIKKLTLYAFSTENWSRNQDEINDLKKIMLSYLESKDIDKIIQNGVIIKIIGNPSKFGEQIQNKIRIIEEKSKLLNSNNPKLFLNIALNYGSRQEIASTFNKIIMDKITKFTNIDDLRLFLLQNQINDNDVSSNLEESDDVDLLIRTGGDFRLSNFLLWQCGYAELFFTKTMWPDFSSQDLLDAISFFAKQNRNFGI